LATSLLALDRRALLKRISLFSELSDRDLGLLAEYTVTRRLEARQELFHRGDRGSECFVLLSGRCKVTSRSPEGKEVTFSIMDPGEVFGEIALLHDQQRTATVVAMEPCDLLVVARRDLLPLLERQPSMALKVMNALARRLSRLTLLVEDTLFRNLPARLARKLLGLASQYGERTDDGVRIDMKLSQTELGNLVGTSRESVNKQMKTWEREGVLEHVEGIVTLRDRHYFEALAEQIDI